MEKIIKKAIEGEWNGYLGFIASSEDTLESWFKFRGYEHCEPSIVLDPLFWQALGKSCGWKGELYCSWRAGTNFYKLNEKGEKFVGSESGCPEWMYHAFRFYEINLTEGWQRAVEYLEGIIN